MNEDQSEPQREISLLDVLVIISEAWVLLVVVPVVAALAAFGISQLRSQSYESYSVLAMPVASVSAALTDDVILSAAAGASLQVPSEISSKLDVRPATGSSSDTVVALRLSDRALVASLLEAIVAKIDQTVGQDFLAKQRQSVVQRLEEIQESIATYKRAIARLDASLVQLERQTNSDLSVYPTTTNTLVGLMENLRKLNDTQRTLLQEMEEIPSSIVKERVSQPRLIGPSSTRIALAIAVVTSLGLLIFVFARAGLRMVVTTSAGLTKVNRIRRAFWLPPRPASSDGG